MDRISILNFQFSEFHFGNLISACLLDWHLANWVSVYYLPSGILYALIVALTRRSAKYISI